MNDSANKKEKRNLAYWCLGLLVLFFGIGFLNGYTKVRADETDGLINGYTAYKVEPTGDFISIVMNNNFDVSLDYDGEYGEWMETSYLFTTNFLISHMTNWYFSHQYGEIYTNINDYIDDGAEVSGVEVMIYLRSFDYAKCLLIKNEYVSDFDAMLEYYTYDASNNRVYPLNLLFTKLEDPSDIYTLIDNLEPFNLLLNFGRNHYIYYYGSASANYNEGYLDGYEAAQNEDDYGAMYKVFSSVFTGARNVLNTKILGEITLGNILSIPLFFGLVILIFKLLGGA